MENVMAMEELLASWPLLGVFFMGIFVAIKYTDRMSIKNETTTKELYEANARTNRDMYDKMEKKNREMISQIQKASEVEREYNRQQIRELNDKLINVKNEMMEYKDETTRHRIEDRELFSKTISEQNRIFTEATNSFNNAIEQFSQTTKKIDKLEDEVTEIKDIIKYN